MEFRIRNAYRDGDMKAHRRVAKNCALIECAQVAAEKAKWPIRDELKRMSSRVGGGETRATITPSPPAGTAPPPRSLPTRTGYERPANVPAPVIPPTAPAPAPAPPPPQPAQTRHGVTRFSSVFGTRRR
jgi:hypothetical protein